MKYIVSEKHGFVYFVSPKVACTSIKRALLPCFDIDAGKYRFTDARGVERIRVHRAFDESGVQVDQRRLLARWDDYAGWFKFGFVRNPWDRLVSCYDQKVYRPNSKEPAARCLLRPPYGDDSAFCLCMPFEDFVERVHQIPDAEADPHFRSQSVIFCRGEADDTVLADFVGRFENLAADFERIKQRIGLGPAIGLRHELKTRTRLGRAYQTYYNARTRALVAERYEKDIRLFAYQYDGAPGCGSEPAALGNA